MKRFSRLSLLAVGLALSIAADAVAVGTRTFDLEDGDDFKGGDLSGVAVDSVGRVRAGFNLGSIPVSEGTAIWSLLERKDGSVLVGTGNEGKLLEVRGGKTKVVADTKALVVTSLAEAWGGAVIVGTLADGKLMKLDGGKLSDFVKLDGVEHIWQVAFDPKTNALFVGTGPNGKLFRVTAGGNAQVYFDATEQHLVSVAVAPDGTVYAGASDKAKLYKVTGPGRASVLYDFGRTEVRAIAVGAKGEVFAIANEIKEGRYTPKRKRGGDDKPAGPTPTPKPVKGKGTLYGFSADGTPEQLLDDDDEHFVSLAIGADGKPYVGTGVEGRVYSIDDSHNSVLVADTDERQVGALLLGGKNRFVASSDPAVLHPVRGIGGADAVWTSKVLDSGIRARFGRMTWDATGTLEFSTRSGNTEEPDDTWSSWSKPMVAAGVVASPPARFLQVRARWSRDRDAVLSEVTIPFVTDNLRAMVTEIEASSGAKKKKESKKDKGIEASGGPVDEKPSTEVKLSWKVNNPDKDELRYRLQYRLIGTTSWYDMLESSEKLTKESYEWDTSDLPEGRYRVRVVASDELSNPPGKAKQHVLESGIVLVDNTPPEVNDLRLVGGKITGTAIDGVGPIQRVEVSVVGTDEWFPFYPKDGIFDEQREDIEADVAGLLPQTRPIMLGVRVYDAANNFVVRNIALK